MSTFNTIGILQGPPAIGSIAEDTNGDVNPTEEELSTLDALQMLLDVVGLIPAAGAPADIINGLISAARGDWWGAGFSLFGVIPVAGEAATVAKIIAKSEKYLQALKVVEKKVLPNLPGPVRRKLEEALELAKKKIDELTGKKPNPPVKPKEPDAPEKPPEGGRVKDRDCKMYEKGPPGAKYQGGKHGAVQKDSARGVRESHHIPPKSVTPSSVSDYKGPAISMDYADHRGLSSTGRLSTHPSSMAQAKLASSGPAGFLTAMTVEITEVRTKYGDKYDAAIAWMLLYAACMGYIVP